MFEEIKSIESHGVFNDESTFLIYIEAENNTMFGKMKTESYKDFKLNPTWEMFAHYGGTLKWGYTLPKNFKMKNINISS